MSKGSNAAKKGSSEVGFQPTDKTKLAGKTPPATASASPSPWTKDDKLPVEYPTSNVVAAYNSILGKNSGRPVIPTGLVARAKDYGIAVEHLWLRNVSEAQLEEAVDMLDEAVENYETSMTRPGSRDHDPGRDEGLMQDAFELVGYSREEAYEEMSRVMMKLKWSPSAPEYDDEEYREMMADDLDYAEEIADGQ